MLKHGVVIGTAMIVLIAVFTRAEAVKTASAPAPRKAPIVVDEPVAVDAVAKLDEIARPVTRDVAAEKSEVVATESWDAFYAMAKGLRVTEAGLQELLVKRVASSLALSSEQTDRLARFVEAEQLLVTKHAVLKYGDRLYALSKATGPVADAFWADLVLLRDGVRRACDAHFARFFDGAQVETINAQLRNDRIMVAKLKDAQGDKYLVVGVGR